MEHQEIVKIGHYTCEITAKDGKWNGKCVVPTPAGNVVICAHASEATIRQLLAQQGGAEVGRWHFGRRLKRLARGKIIRGITHGLSKVVNNPLMRKAMSAAKFIPGYGPMINKAYTTARRVTNVADRLARGHGGARTAVREMRQMAERHMNPRTRRRARATLNQIRSTYAMRYGLGRGRSRASGDVMHLRGWQRKDLGPVSIVGAENGARELWGAIHYGVEAKPSKARLDYVRGQRLLAGNASASGY